MSDLYKFQSAAITHCINQGLDPNEPCGLDNPHGHAVYHRGVRWQRVAMEMSALAAMMWCMKNTGVLP